MSSTLKELSGKEIEESFVLIDALNNAIGKQDAFIFGRDGMLKATTQGAKDAVISETQALLSAVHYDICWFLEAEMNGSIDEMIDEIKDEVAALEKRRDELNARAKANGQTIV